MRCEIAIDDWSRNTISTVALLSQCVCSSVCAVGRYLETPQHVLPVVVVGVG